MRAFAADGGAGRYDNNPTFEFVKSKYISDIPDTEVDWSAASQRTTDDKIQALLQKPPGFFKLRSNLRLLATGACFGFLSFMGFVVATMSVAHLVGPAPRPAFMDLLIFVGGLGTEPQTSLRFAEQIVTVASLAFLGGYIAAAREFLRRMSLFDLASYTFLKQALEILASMIAVVFLYRAFPNPYEQIKDIGASVSTVPESISFAWLAVAPLLGLYPESATRYLFLRARTGFNWLKSEDNRFNPITRSTPLDVIDGIDFWTRIRLEQCGIFDVQNLATYNPIMLYIETPYGIYQVFDWTAQAQLCHIVGIEKFLLLREINIRTIFDLERAIRSADSPDQFDAIIAAILLAPTETIREASSIAGAKFLIIEGGKPLLQSDFEAYALWARETIGDSSGTTKAIEHMVSWITDDLHVRRLRRLWIEISESLGESALMLPDDKKFPGRSAP
ncbi:MAG: hypothetical protein KL863_06455 [Rhizobium sp.]|nr:hypothetical protein [Rhizobium sp.]